jgi:hypothetical protein
MSKLFWSALLACASAGCASVPDDWSVQAGSCVSTEAITFSGLGAGTDISPSGRYVSAGDSFIDLDRPGGDGVDGRISKLRSYERSVFSSEDVLFTTSGPAFIRYRWDGGWAQRERFTLGNGDGIAALLSSVGPYDVQRKGGAALLVGFSAPSGGEDAYRLVMGDFGGEKATATAEISFAGAHEVFASDEFVIVEADVFPDEMVNVRRHHTVLGERQGSVCVSGFVSCNRQAPAVRALIALAPDLKALEDPTAAMSALVRTGFADILSVNNRGDILASTRSSADGGASVVLLAADGSATPVLKYPVLTSADVGSEAALSDSGRAVMLFSAGHQGKKRLVVADIRCT